MLRANKEQFVCVCVYTVCENGFPPFFRLHISHLIRFSKVVPANRCGVLSHCLSSLTYSAPQILEREQSLEMAAQREWIAKMQAVLGPRLSAAESAAVRAREMYSTVHDEEVSHYVPVYRAIMRPNAH